MTTTAPAPAADLPVHTTRARKAAGWAVHFYTATGVVAGFLFLLRGIEGELKEAFVWAAVAMFVDGTDGMLARRVDVKKHVPEFDGALLDNIVDYLTYVFAPLVLLHQNDFLPEGNAGLVMVALPLLASCYQFCRCDAKEGNLFWGFPDYSNVIAFYAVVFQQSVTTTVVVLLVCTVLVFVPVGYLYPSRATDFRRSALVTSSVWGIACIVLLVQLPDPSRALAWASLLYVVYYVLVSLELTRRVNARS